MSEFGEYNAIAALPELVVTDPNKGDLPPCGVEEVSFKFQHSQAEKPIPYIDDALHEWTGRDPIEITTKLHFNNKVAPGSFPDGWNTWREALFDGGVKEMVHPILGTLNVVVMGGDVQVVSQYRAGVVVNVTWRTTILDPELAQEFSPLSLTLEEAAVAADAAMANAGLFFPSGYVATSLSELLGQINSVAFLVELQVLGLIGEVQGIIDQVHDIATTDPTLIANHATIEVKDALMTLWATTEAIKERATFLARKTKSVLTTAPTTLDAFARDNGNTLAEVIGLNVGALATPVVPAGVMLKAFA
jgi:prophage DNA circulation protein